MLRKRSHRGRGLGWLALVSSMVLVAVTVTGGTAMAKGGTAKPPKGAVAPFVTPTLGDPVFSVDPRTIQGFDVTGFVQTATVSADNRQCPSVSDPHRLGGTVVLNNVTVTVPCNLVIQMPANTFTWADFVNGGPALTIGSGFPSYELRAVGNVVGGRHIAALLFVSQQSLNGGSGIVTGFDYANGVLTVDGGGTTSKVQVNDPKVNAGGGRFSAGKTPDDRFSVDQANPTVHSATGYPMCIPRTDPATSDDALCPQKNRPQVTSTVGCRNFSQAGVTPPTSGELSRPVAGQRYCTQYVMKSTTDTTRVAADPDPRQQVPFAVGDFVSFSGTLVRTATGDYISAHTIEANVGVYTQPGTQPSYIAIGGFGVGTADPNAVSVSGVGQETQDRIFLEAATTDVKTPVDIYMMDVDPQSGAVRNRWVTPFEMTGENQAGNPSGGITTQNTGPQPQRARIRATKAPAGLLSQPTRTIRVVQRSLCAPQATADQSLLDACLANAPVVANGLVAGQYVAPVFEFIFPENVKPGDGVVPNDFWHLPFLRFGEGATTASSVGPGVGALDPAPW
jgi:hypothetical protein